MANLPNPSQETYELVRQLYEARNGGGDADSSPGWLELLTRRSGADRTDKSIERRISLVRRIAEREEPGILPYLLCALFDEPEVVRATIEAVVRLVRSVPTNRLPALSDKMRRPWWDWVDYEDWNTLEPAHLLRFEELGEPEPPFWGLLSFHSNGYIREPALGWLDPADYLDEFVAALQDDIGSNSRAAAGVVSDHLHKISPERLLQIYADDSRGHVRKNIRRLFNELGYWNRLEFLLYAANASDAAEDVEQVDVQLRKWIGDANRVFTSPSAAQHERVEEALFQTAERLPQETVAEIRRVLKLKAR